MRRVILYTAACLLIVAVTTSATAKTRPPASYLVCKADLSSWRQGTPAHFPRSIQFVDDVTLAVAFVVQERGPVTLFRRGQVETKLPYSLRTTLLDATTCKTVRQFAWPTESAFESRLIATTDLYMITQRGSKLTLYNNSGEEAADQITLPPAMGQQWVPFSSPSGKSILFINFIHDARKKPTPRVWLDADNFKVLRTWNELPTGAISISDDSVAEVQCPSTAYWTGCGAEIRSLANGSSFMLPDTPSRPQFVSNTLLFMHGWSTSSFAALVSLDTRKAVFQRNLGSLGQLFGPAVPSANGVRFVVPIFRSREDTATANEFLPGKLMYFYVFDRSGRNLSIVNIPGLSLGPRPTGFALSPNGQLLAILEDFKTLLILRLPLSENH